MLPLRVLFLFLTFAVASSAGAQPVGQWAERPLAEVSVPAATAAEISCPLAVRVEGGEVFISDFGDYRVERLSADGGWRGAYGDESYRSAFRNVSDVAVRGDTVWVADMQEKAVSVFTRDGAFVRRMPVPYNVGRLVVMGDEIVTLGVGGESPLAVLNRSGDVVRWTGEGLGGDRLDGFTRANAALVPDGDGYLYLRLGANRLERFDETGAPSGIVPVATHSALPNGRAVTQRELRSVSVDGDTLWVHVRLTVDDRTVVSVLDRYARDGDYHESTLLPQRFYDVAVSEGRVYALTDAGLRMFDLD